MRYADDYLATQRMHVGHYFYDIGDGMGDAGRAAVNAAFGCQTSAHAL